MRKILQIVRNDLRLFFLSRENLISLLFVPVVMTLVVGIFSGNAASESPEMLVDVIDRDGSPLSAQLLEALREANSSLILCPLDNDTAGRCELDGAGEIGPEQARGRLEERVTEAAIVIPPGFETGVRSFEPVQVTLYTLEDIGVPEAAEQALNAALQRVNGAAAAARTGAALVSQNGLLPDEDSRSAFAKQVYDRASQIWAEEPVTVNFEYAGDPPSGGPDLQSGLGQSVPGMGAMFVMFTVFGGMTALAEERAQWTLQRLATAPLSRAQLLGGKILARFVLGALQFMVVFAVGIAAGIQLGRDPLALMLVAFAYTLSITALSFALGTWIKNEAQAGGFSLLLSLVLAPLGGAWWPLEIVPRAMQIVGHISPVAWAMDAFNALIFNQARLPDVVLPIAVLLGITAVAFAWAIARFRYEG